MSRWLSTLLCLALAQDVAEPVLQVRLDFEAAEASRPLAEFTAHLSGQGAPGLWQIKEDPQAASGKKVLVQSNADTAGFRFPLLVYDKMQARDVAVSVKLKPVSGTVDQAGGVVARFKDDRSYYIARANALENNVHLYRVVGGVRHRFAGADTKITPGEWHTLKLEIKDSQFKVSFDGKLLFEAVDETYRDAGKAGVWTKADSLTYFDDLSIESYDEP